MRDKTEEEELRELLKRKSEEAEEKNAWEDDFWGEMENAQP